MYEGSYPCSAVTHNYREQALEVDALPSIQCG